MCSQGSGERGFDVRQRLVDGVVGADQEIGADARELVRRRRASARPRPASRRGQMHFMYSASECVCIETSGCACGAEQLRRLRRRWSDSKAPRLRRSRRRYRCAAAWPHTFYSRACGPSAKWAKARLGWTVVAARRWMTTSGPWDHPRAMGLRDLFQGKFVDPTYASVHAGGDIITTTVDAMVKWGRKSSIWPMPFGTACCAIEFMARVRLALRHRALRRRGAALLAPPGRPDVRGRHDRGQAGAGPEDHLRPDARAQVGDLDGRVRVLGRLLPLVPRHAGDRRDHPGRRLRSGLPAGARGADGGDHEDPGKDPEGGAGKGPAGRASPGRLRRRRHRSPRAARGLGEGRRQRAEAGKPARGVLKLRVLPKEKEEPTGHHG